MDGTMKASSKIIGHGTWYDKIAVDIVAREKKIGRSLDSIRIESGVAASGIPHIGSFSEVTRNYAVSLALKEQDYNSEFIVFSDNNDGLRSVPTGLPKYLKKFLGFPVTEVPDPFKCHKSYGDHMVYLLLEALDKSGVDYTFMSAVESYEKGSLKEEIEVLLRNATQVGEIVEQETGQDKYLEVLPYFPVCASCGRIYTTHAYKFLPRENKVLYKCKGMEIKRKWLKGCGHEGEADYTKGEGKISWKAEFAARWRALEIQFEAYGKDIADSVRVNDRISREVLSYEPPMHIPYEMYLDKGGKKISKSMGNVFTPQVWFRYGSPQSMVLLTLKRFIGTRNISVVDISKYMDELDELEDVYFGRKRIGDLKEKTKLKGLYGYCWFMKTPQNPTVHVPYNLLVGLARVSPPCSGTTYVIDKLKDYGYLKGKAPADLEKRVEYALNWARDFGETRKKDVEISPEERNAVIELIQRLKAIDDPELIQGTIFETARKNGVTIKRFFNILYNILLGIPSGPRLGPYVIDIGKEKVIKTLKMIVETPEVAQ